MRTVGVGSGAAAPSVWGLAGIERRAWRIGLPTRRLFLILALVTAVAVAAGGLASAWVVGRNAGTIDAARDQGLGVARAATEFRTNLVAADAQAATTLLAGGLETPAARRAYDESIVDAGQWLTRAALMAPDDDAEDIEALADGLVTYAGLVETARANARQGYPVSAAYLGQARALARDDLVPRAERLRRSGEQRLARAANSIAGPSGLAAVGTLAVGLVALSGSAAVVAGRTRRLTHPWLLVGAFAGVAAFGLVTAGVWSQGRELRRAATDDIDAYVAANDAAFTLSSLRVTEISAVAARGSGQALYRDFDTSAEALAADLRGGDQGALADAVERYSAGVDQVEEAEAGGDTGRAAEIVLTGESAQAFAEADADARAAVSRARRTLGERLDAASGAEVPALVPVALGLVAAGAATAGVLARARRYR
ncbi:MAG TPA: hypothetical protein VIL48_03315 [Acidimicrobiales bacterium]